VIVPDINLLLYAYDDRSRYHSVARDWWQETLSGGRRVGLTWHTMLGFIRLTTNPRLFDFPMSAADAIQVVRSWLDQPAVEILSPGERHGDIVFGLIEEAGAAGNLTSDAHLAAIAIEHQAELASADRDFGRFEGLRCFNPLSVKSR
jgi:toxin-antitoxin system PIN domain toxin